MRKSLSVAVCALVLACVHGSQAGADQNPRVAKAEGVKGQIQKVVHWLAPEVEQARDGTAAAAGTQAAAVFKSGSEAQEQEQERDHAAMLLAGLAIMAVIIRRYYARRD